MRKSKSGDRKAPPPRLFGKFEIGPNSHPRKVARWLARGGGSPYRVKNPAGYLHSAARRRAMV